MSEENAIDWQLNSAPLYVNIGGPRGIGKRALSLEIVKRFQQNNKNVRAAVFFSGNVNRYVAMAVIRRREGNQSSLSQLTKQAAIEAMDHLDEVAAFASNSTPGFTEEWASESVERFLLDIARDDYSLPAMRNLRRSVRDYIAARVDLLITTYPGHFPYAPLSFFLLASQTTRISRAQRNPALNPWAIKEIIEAEDRNDIQRLESKHEIVTNSSDDPAARLARYAGHFTPIWIDGIDSETDEKVISEIQHQLQLAWKSHSEKLKMRKKLLGLFEQDRITQEGGSYSLLLLKGGGFGELYGSINASILHRLIKDNQFVIFLGSTHNVTLQEALRRWDTLRAITKNIRGFYANNPNLGECPHLVRDIEYGLESLDHWRVQKWLNQLEAIGQGLPINPRTELYRAIVFLKYVVTASQYFLLKRVCSREAILKQWEINKTDITNAVARASKKGITLADVPNAVETLDEQEFIKFLLIGEAGPNRAHQHSLRSLVWTEIMKKPTKLFKDFIHEAISIEQFASILNGIHGPLSPRDKDRELQKEISLLPMEDVLFFTEVFKSDSERR